MKAKKILWTIILVVCVCQSVLIGVILNEISKNLCFDIPMMILCGVVLLVAIKKIIDSL